VKILIVKLHALGDLVIATPAIRRLRQGFPDAHIELLTTDWAEPAIRGSRLVDEVISVPSDLFFAKNLASMNGLARLLFNIRARKYDASIAFHLSRKIHSWIALGGINNRFGFNSAVSGNFIPLDEQRHSALTAWELADLTVRSLGGIQFSPASIADLKYDWVVTSAEGALAAEHLAGMGIIEPYATLFPGGGTNPSASAHEKRWTPEGFTQLAKWLRDERNMKVLVMGSSSDASCAAEVAGMAGENVMCLAGKTDVRTTAAIIARSVIAVSNDSAPMHIASAVGTPTLGIFGPTGAVAKAPLGDRCSAISLGLPCSPCYFATFKGCIFDTIRCMQELSAEKVINAAAALLDASRDKADE